MLKCDLKQSAIIVLSVLEPFGPKTTRTYSPRLGASLTLPCTPPRSYPQPDIFWAMTGFGGDFIPVDPTDRITIDPEGKGQTLTQFLFILTVFGCNLQIAGVTLLRKTTIPLILPLST
jgi:hypothetical protein